MLLTDDGEPRGMEARSGPGGKWPRRNTELFMRHGIPLPWTKD